MSFQAPADANSTPPGQHGIPSHFRLWHSSSLTRFPDPSPAMPAHVQPSPFDYIRSRPSGRRLVHSHARLRGIRPRHSNPFPKSSPALPSCVPSSSLRNRFLAFQRTPCSHIITSALFYPSVPCRHPHPSPSAFPLADRTLHHAVAPPNSSANPLALLCRYGAYIRNV